MGPPSLMGSLTGLRPLRIQSNISRLFQLLCENPYGLYTNEIMERLYANDPEGGPESNSIVGVMVWRFNRLARENRLGLEIHVRAGYRRVTRGGRYCIWVVRH